MVTMLMTTATPSQVSDTCVMLLLLLFVLGALHVLGAACLVC
jgi:hypothetical protein